MKEYSAGAIVYRCIDNEIYYLLIKDFHNNWGFPKGHLENDETFRQAAIREVKEEVGIDVEIKSTFKSELVYKMPNGVEKHSLYYIGKYDNQVPHKQENEVQQVRLFTYEEALEQLSFANMRKTLVEADILIRGLNK